MSRSPFLSGENYLFYQVTTHATRPSQQRTNHTPIFTQTTAQTPSEKPHEAHSNDLQPFLPCQNLFSILSPSLQNSLCDKLNYLCFFIFLEIFELSLKIICRRFNRHHAISQSWLIAVFQIWNGEGSNSTFRSNPSKSEPLHKIRLFCFSRVFGRVTQPTPKAVYPPPVGKGKAPVTGETGCNT